MKKMEKALMILEGIGEDYFLVSEGEKYFIEKSGERMPSITKSNGEKLKKEIIGVSKSDEDTILIDFKNLINGKKEYMYFSIEKKEVKDKIDPTLLAERLFEKFDLLKSETFMFFLKNISKKGVFSKTQDENMLSFLANKEYSLFDRECVFIKVQSDEIILFEKNKWSKKEKNIFKIREGSLVDVKKEFEILEGEVRRYGNVKGSISYSQRLLVAEAVNAVFFRNTFLENKITFNSLSCIPLSAKYLLKRARTMTEYCSLFFGDIPYPLDDYSLETAFSFAYYLKRFEEKDKITFYDFLKKFRKTIENTRMERIFLTNICNYNNPFRKNANCLSFLEMGVAITFFETLFPQYRNTSVASSYLAFCEYKKCKISIEGFKKYIKEM